MQFRADSNPVFPSTGVGGPVVNTTDPQVPHGLSVDSVGSLGAGNPTPGGNVSGFDQGLQAYRPMVGRADKHASNIGGTAFQTGISQLHGTSS